MHMEGLESACTSLFISCPYELHLTLMADTEYSSAGLGCISH